MTADRKRNIPVRVAKPLSDDGRGNAFAEQDAGPSVLIDEPSKVCQLYCGFKSLSKLQNPP